MSEITGYSRKPTSAEPSPLITIGRLLLTAGLFLGAYTIALTLAPAVRTHSWDIIFRWDYWLALLSWGIAFGLIYVQIRRLNIRTDPVLLMTIALLSGWGLLTIYRIFPELGLRQSIWIIFGGIVVSAGLQLNPDLSFFRRYKYLWLTAGLALTALTLIFGTNPLGSGPRLWLGCCGLYFQPSEPLKLLLIVYLSAYLADQFVSIPITQRAPNKVLLPILAPTILLIGIALGLLIVQRDLGTATILLFLYATMTYLASGRKLILVISGLAIFVFGILGYFLFDLVALRIDAWINPWSDPTGRSYQIIQSLIAIANGGLFGRGPGLGNPGLVPVAHSDFIFTTITEETGLLGAIGLILLLAILAARGLRIAIRAESGYKRLLAAGLTAYLVGQSILIIGGNLRVLPLTGVTLPFVSYGGSSLVTSFIALLLLIHISQSTTRYQYPLVDKRPYQTFGLLFLSGLFVISLVAGWWAIYRGENLLTRPDNPRRYINDIYSKRGSLLDRSNEYLTESIGSSGSYERVYNNPNLGPILGYTHPIFGQSGLEASLDDYLRGLAGNPNFSIWWHSLLYGQYPPGLDVRLSLETNLQNLADQSLSGLRGAIVLMDAQTGEILVMSSSPTFDPNQLENNWESLITNENAPLLNRVTLGRYQPGTTLGVLWLAAYNATGRLFPDIPESQSLRLGNDFLTCAINPADTQTWGTLILNGCPGASLALVSALAVPDNQTPIDVLKAFGLYTQPQLRLPVASPSEPETSENLTALAVGQSDLLISPLQLALAASAISTNGDLPAPRIALAVDTPQSGFVVLPPQGNLTNATTSVAAQKTQNQLAVENQSYWGATATALNGNQTISWYIAGTLPSWGGSPLGLVVLIEENQPKLAQEIGEKLLQTALSSP
jgi:cell division protein FtsW (lipid II flippase)